MDVKTEALSALGAIEGMAGVVARADHADVVRVRGQVSLQAFLAGMFGRRPAWLRFLYWLRSGLAFLLGLGRETPPGEADLRPGDVPMAPGAAFGFLTVLSADKDRHWIAMGEDRHLRAWLGVLTTPEPRGGNRFNVVTVVVYRHWIGPIYFNIIRPFHHLVVRRMAKAGLASRPAVL